MMEAYKKQGNSLWKSFNASKEDKLTFYEGVYKETHNRFNHPLIKELGIILKRAKLIL